MIVRLTEDTIRKTKVLLCAIHNSHLIKICDIARIIGYLISSFLGLKYDALYYRYLEMHKIRALKQSKGGGGCIIWMTVTMTFAIPQ